MVSLAERVRSELVPLTVFAILGLGFVLLFADVSWFWMVWVIGFAVVLPVVAILLDEDDEELSAEPEEPVATTTDTEDDSLAVLRARYARGELTDEQFERKLERLLETETLESVEDQVERERER